LHLVGDLFEKSKYFLKSVQHTKCFWPNIEHGPFRQCNDSLLEQALLLLCDLDVSSSANDGIIVYNCNMSYVTMYSKPLTSRNSSIATLLSVTG